MSLPTYNSADHPDDVSAKHKYIREMHQFYKRFDDYKEVLNRNISGRLGTVESIIISKKEIMAKINNPEFYYIISTEDSRDCALESMNFSGFEPVDGYLLFNACKFLSNRSNEITFMDIGANGGWYSLALTNTYRNIKSIAFEPSPTTYSKLCKNIKANGLDERIIPINCAVSKDESDKYFYFSESLSGNASLVDHSHNSSSRKVKVKCAGIDRMKNDLQINNPYLMKIDTEGSELHVVESAINTIQSERPIIFIELSRKWCSAFNYHPNKIIELLKSMNYQCVTIDQTHKLKHIYEITDSTQETNFLFVPQDDIDSFVNSFTIELEVLNQ